jgi:hypothetical protein
VNFLDDCRYASDFTEPIRSHHEGGDAKSTKLKGQEDYFSGRASNPPKSYLRELRTTIVEILRGSREFTVGIQTISGRREFTAETRSTLRKNFMKQNSELRDLCVSAVNSSCAPLVAALPRWVLRG